VALSHAKQGLYIVLIHRHPVKILGLAHITLGLVRWVVGIGKVRTSREGWVLLRVLTVILQENAALLLFEGIRILLLFLMTL